MPNRIRPLSLLLALPLALSLSACGNSKVRVVKPPIEKLTCAGEPLVPPGEITDAMVADYMIAQRAAWFDCHTKVEWLRDFFAKLPS